jgi:hypothetical protein
MAWLPVIVRRRGSKGIPCPGRHEAPAPRIGEQELSCGFLKNEVRRYEALLACNKDDIVGNLVAVVVSLDQHRVISHFKPEFACDAAERRAADEHEGIVAGGGGIGIDSGQVNDVGLRIEVGDDIGSGRHVVEAERVASCPAGQDIRSCQTLDYVIAKVSCKRIAPRRADQGEITLDRASLQTTDRLEVSTSAPVMRRAFACKTGLTPN